MSIIAAGLFLCSCGGGGSESAQTPTPVVATNSPPIFTSNTKFSVSENQLISIQISGHDSDGDEITYRLNDSADVNLFSINSSTGVISAETETLMFNFEAPLDANEDNKYDLSVTIDDGKVTRSTPIEILILNQREPATCTTGETVSFEENTTGLLYVFNATDPDGGSDLVYRSFEVRRGEPYGYSNQFIEAISFNELTGELALSNPVDAEREGTEYSFVVTAAAKFGDKFASCDVTLNLVDIPGQVTSGVKVDGIQETTSPIGDIDGDGRGDLWVEAPITAIGKPDQPGGYVLYGASVDMKLSPDSDRVLNLDAMDFSEAVHIFAEFPAVGDADSDGTHLIGSQLNDVNGDGIPELLLGLKPKIGSLDEATFTTRPLAYLLWGDAILGQDDGEIDLNNLLPSEGIQINGLADIERSGLSIGSGDFDGDGIADVTIGLPLMLDHRLNDDFDAGYVYIVYGKTLRQAASSGRLNLSEMSPSEGIVIHDKFHLPWKYMGHDVSSLGDIDGDGADELVVVGNGKIGVMHSSLFLNNTSGDIKILDIERGNEFLNIFHHTKGHGITLSRKKGDVDGDGKFDLLISGDDAQFGLGALFPAAHILDSDYNTLNGLNLNPYTDAKHPYVSFVNSYFYAYRAKSGSFIGDLDGDGLDDFALSGKVDDDSGNANVYVFLSKTFNITDESIIFNVDDLKAGEGLRLTGPYIGGSISGVDDLDGDGIPELYISADVYASESGPFPERYGKTGYLIPGSDLMEAINSGIVDFDLDSRFNDEAK